VLAERRHLGCAECKFGSLWRPGSWVRSHSPPCRPPRRSQVKSTLDRPEPRWPQWQSGPQRLTLEQARATTSRLICRPARCGRSRAAASRRGASAAASGCSGLCRGRRRRPAVRLSDASPCRLPTGRPQHAPTHSGQRDGRAEDEPAEGTRAAVYRPRSHRQAIRPPLAGSGAACSGGSGVVTAQARQRRASSRAPTHAAGPRVDLRVFYNRQRLHRSVGYVSPRTVRRGPKLINTARPPFVDKVTLCLRDPLSLPSTFTCSRPYLRGECPIFDLTGTRRRAGPLISSSRPRRCGGSAGAASPASARAWGAHPPHLGDAQVAAGTFGGLGVAVADDPARGDAYVCIRCATSLVSAFIWASLGRVWSKCRPGRCRSRAR
jgi:hypothetical protein